MIHLAAIPGSQQLRNNKNGENDFVLDTGHRCGNGQK
ncbi:hypothetical protein V6x_21050 [Gimesia chilikensis]|uniref:Uncharacterized protein n=1 Tax=Gimesia chilikensis TaxID=2605989 RepID=A0A517WAX2_9PLAN|nr:hypothetical protein V6x_21050 [Gimesia chilikensis]